MKENSAMKVNNVDKTNSGNRSSGKRDGKIAIKNWNLKNCRVKKANVIDMKTGEMFTNHFKFFDFILVNNLAHKCISL